jgi:hypothetical protein
MAGYFPEVVIIQNELWSTTKLSNEGSQIICLAVAKIAANNKPDLFPATGP